MTDDEKAQEITEALVQVWYAKGKEPLPKMLETYAKILGRYPLKAIRAACAACAADDDPFPPVAGKLIKEMARWLRTQRLPDGSPRIPTPEEAWLRARLTIARFQPVTRPEPKDGYPAIDAALAEMGGVRACQWTDSVGEGIVKRRFLEEYDKASSTPETVSYALSEAVRAPRLVEGIELPANQRESWPDVQAKSARQLDGQRPPTVYQLPAKLDEPLTDEQRQANVLLLRENVEKLAQAWGMMAPKEDDGGPEDAEDAANDTGGRDTGAMVGVRGVADA